MTEPPIRPRPGMTERTLAEKQARAERAAAALRANLRKRKQQARARGDQQQDVGGVSEALPIKP